jgi:hypothetical protein
MGRQNLLIDVNRIHPLSSPTLPYSIQVFSKYGLGAFKYHVQRPNEILSSKWVKAPCPPILAINFRDVPTFHQFQAFMKQYPMRVLVKAEDEFSYLEYLEVVQELDDPSLGMPDMYFVFDTTKPIVETKDSAGLAEPEKSTNSESSLLCPELMPRMDQMESPWASPLTSPISSPFSSPSIASPASPLYLSDLSSPPPPSPCLSQTIFQFMKELNINSPPLRHVETSFDSLSPLTQLLPELVPSPPPPSPNPGFRRLFPPMASPSDKIQVSYLEVEVERGRKRRREPEQKIKDPSRKLHVVKRMKSVNTQVFT